MLVYDYIFIVIILIFSTIGLYSGFISILKKILQLVIPIFITYTFNNNFYDYLIKDLNFYGGYFSRPLSILILFILIYFTIFIIFFTLEKIITIIGMGIIDKILGLFFGSICGIILGYIFLKIVYHFFSIKTLFLNEINSLINIVNTL